MMPMRGNMHIQPLLLINVFVVLVMFSIGLRVRGSDLLDVMRDRNILIRTLVANCVLIPAIGILLVSIFPLPHDAMIGLLLLAAIPGTPIAMQFTSRVQTRLAFAAGMTAVLALVSIVMTPLAVEVFPQAARDNQRPLLSLVSVIFAYIALPLCAGLWVGRRAPGIAPKLVLPLVIVASVAFSYAMWETRVTRREALLAIAGHGTILSLALLFLSSMLIGWMIGKDADTRRVLATSTSMRNIVIVLYIARYCFSGTGVYMMPLVYLSIMVPANTLFYLSFEVWRRFHRPKHAQAT
jgi:BASS family bile acid:Na+ symporter